MKNFFTHAVMIGSLVLVYIHFMILLIQLQELKCLCSEITKALSELTVPKPVHLSLTFFLYSE
jgi:hypothetical protein